MILIGQYDSPYVRRVALSMHFHGLGFEHRPWSTFSDAALIRPLSPLLRVPVLVTGDGTALTESAAILDFVDGLVPAADRLIPAAEPDRHRVLRVLALLTGACDKAVSLFYEAVNHDTPVAGWVARCTGQVRDTLAVLDGERGRAPHWFGGRLGQADITLACVWRFLAEAHPGLASDADFPALAAAAAAQEATEPFRRLSQPFIPPRRDRPGG
jgi:glutathione S-transferase